MHIRIRIDKLAGPPEHALTRRDVRAVLSVVPKEWNVWLRVVHLKETCPHTIGGGSWVLYQFLQGPRLNVYCRGEAPETVRRLILQELAIQGLGMGPRYGHALTHTEEQELARIIPPLLQKVDTLLQDSQTPLPARETIDDHAVYEALKAAGYAFDEAYQILRAIEAERKLPTSRTKGNRIHKARQILLDAGFDPDTLAPLPPMDP